MALWKPGVVNELMIRASRAKADHALRHQPSGFGFVFADRIGYLDPAAWDLLTLPSSIFIQRSFLGLLEQHGPANITGRYAVIFRGSRPVAAVAAQIALLRGSELVRKQANATDASRNRIRNTLRAAAGRAKAGAIQRVSARVLICGNLLSWGMHGLAFADGEDVAALWPAVADALYRIRRAEKLTTRVDAMLVKDVTEDHSIHASVLRRFSYDRIEPESDMVLPIRPEWRSHADYVNSLSSKYRKAVRRTFDDVQSAGYDVRAVADLTTIGPRLHELYLHVHDRAAARPFTLPPAFLPALARTCGDAFRCTTIARNDDIAGFVTTVKDGETAVGYYLGYDPDVNETTPIYFRLLQAVVADAIELGCRRLSLGRTALEPKARLGAKPAPLAIYVRHRHPLLNAMLKPLLGLIPHHDAPERDPFK